MNGVGGQEPGAQGGPGAVSTELVRSARGQWQRDGGKEADQRHMAGQTGGAWRDVGERRGGLDPGLCLRLHPGGSIPVAPSPTIQTTGRRRVWRERVSLVRGFWV